MVKERTLVIVKHDGVIRGIAGEIISRFEKVGLKIIGMKMLWADENVAEKHYIVTDEWAKGVFEKTKTTYEKEGKKFPFTNHKEYGTMIKNWNKTFLQEGPVIALVLEAPHVIEVVRKMVGNTEPRQAIPGTIRGDYIYDSYAIADTKQRPIRNLIHASGNKEEATREISLWFTERELHHYETPFDKHF
ncbi:MAG TPA: nucleoside-diphosphate kinase [Candidatus Nanoarchaeia archaeon]|nr:nucleoside-diphosphate kinase [Candidatus Nanoarchaeia archaeon]